MNPLDRLSQYLAGIERRLRWFTLARGAAVTAAAALLLTLGGAIGASWFAFSPAAVTGARVALFLGLAVCLAAALLVPVMRLNHRRAAREAERRFPGFEQRLLTFSERAGNGANDPFMDLLASDALEVAGRVPPEEVARGGWILGFSSAAAVAAAAVVWLVLAGPGFFGYGAALLWAGYPKGELKPFYDIRVEPGNRTVRKRSDQVISARVSGFQPASVRFFAKYQSASKWEAAEMRPGNGGYQFLLAGIPESLDYYVEAGAVRSKAYRLNVVDLPAVKKIRVTYHYPSWTGMRNAVEDPGGDLRAVEGTTADVAVETDRPLGAGTLLLGDGSKIPLRADGGGVLAASVPILHDGVYHVAAMDQGEDVRLSEDYFIEAQKDHPPEVRISRPGRDARVNPIEEVAVEVQGTDDFGLHGLELHYSVNGGPEKTVSLLNQKGRKEAKGSSTIYLEDYNLAPGDVVSLYATARDARATARTDILFVEAQPFEREYSQSQQAGGGEGGGDQDDESGHISQRQKEIIAATWNQLRGGAKEKAAAAENAAFLAQVQSKLRDQALSLANRMRSRQLSGAGDSFRSFVDSMQKAAEAMNPASEELKRSKWQDALAPEQKALQYLLRAEATFREIQVAFGSRGGGRGGANGASRDLEGLFDLELDTEKNQYEANSRAGGAAEQRQKDIDEALQKLEQLARRQQEMAQQPQNQQQVSQQRWQQEMLRREAEELQRQMEQLNRSNSSQLSRNQQGQPSSQGSQSGQQSQQTQSQQLRQALDRLQQATRDMRQAGTPQNAGTPQGQADARRAAERLQQATEMMSRLRRQQTEGEMDELARRAEQLTGRQEDFENRMRQTFGTGSLGQPQLEARRNATPEQADQLAQQKQQILNELKKLEGDMQKSVRNLQGSQPKTSSKLRDALGDMQQQELPSRMEWSAQALRRGLGAYAAMREALTTEAMRNLSRQVDDARKAMGQADASDAKNQEIERALAQVERLRQQLEQRRQEAGDQSRRGGQQQGQQQERESQQLSRDAQGNGRQGQPQNGRQQTGNGQQSPNGQQPGQQEGNAGGQQGGDQRGPGPWNNAYGPRGSFGPVGPWNGEQAYANTMRQLTELERSMRNDPGRAAEVREMIRSLQHVNPRALGNDSVLSGRIENDAAGALEQVETQLRRMAEEQRAGNVRSPSSAAPAPGYSDAVAEYFRRLSKTR